MAIYSAMMKVGSRSAGRSATGSAAYRAGEKITDERTGLIHNYEKKGEHGVDETTILAPPNSPNWVHDRAQLWNKVELGEKRKDSQLYRELIVAIPKELKTDQMKELVIEYAQDNFVSKGMVADVAFHNLKGDNPHAHIMMTMRKLDATKATGFGKKERAWNDKEQLQIWREQWSEHANEKLAKNGHEERIDHRTLEAQGIERIPQIHLGAKVIKMEKRGIRTERGTIALNIEKQNAKIIDLQQYKKKLEAQIKAIEEQPQNELSDRAIEASQKRGNFGRTDRTTSGLDGDLSGRPANDKRGSEKEHSRGQREPRTEDRKNEQPVRPTGQKFGSEISTTGKAQRGHSQKAQISDAEILSLDALSKRNLSSSYQRILDLQPASNDENKTSRSATENRRIVREQSSQLAKKRASKSAQNSRTGRDKMTQDKTYLAARRQLIAMGVKQFEIGIRDSKSGKMMNREWSLDEALKNIPWLKRENAKGADIYVRPAGENNAGIVLVDDLTQAKIKDMKSRGMNPASVVETSPQNFQAWVRISKHEIAPNEATYSSKMLAQQFDADLNSADWKHYGRLAGFTNRKPEHIQGNGKSPFVLSHESSGKIAEKGQVLVEFAKQKVSEQNTRKEKMDRLMALEKPSESKTGDYWVDYYRERQKSLKQRYGAKYDLSRADFMIAKEMSQRKVAPEKIAQTLLEASPELAERKKSHVDDYLNRTVTKAVQEAKKPRSYGHSSPSKDNGPSLG